MSLTLAPMLGIRARPRGAHRARALCAFLAATGACLAVLLSPGSAHAALAHRAAIAHRAAASFSVTPGPAGSPTCFDASASNVVLGSIVHFTWNFGDGSTATSSTATVMHTYAAAGSYTATLTEINIAGTSVTSLLTAQTSRLVSVAAALAPNVLAAGQPTLSDTGTSTGQTPAAVAHVPQPSSAASERSLLPQPVTIQAKPLTATPRGTVVIDVSCPVTAVSGCRGTIAIRLASRRSRRARAARCTRGCRSIATANYEARAGQHLLVRARMSSFGRRLLAHHRRLRVTVTARSVTGRGSVRSTRTVTLTR
jgi:hypothetical protein